MKLWRTWNCGPGRFGEGTATVLQVQQLRLQEQPRVLESADALVEARVDELEQECVQLGRIPPAVHAGLAEAQRTVREDAAIQALVVDMDIVRRGAIDAHAGQREQFLDAGTRT